MTGVAKSTYNAQGKPACLSCFISKIIIKKKNV